MKTPETKVPFVHAGVNENPHIRPQLENEMDYKFRENMAMYGCTTAELDAAYEDAISGGMLVMSIMSDAQTVMEAGQQELARQFINRAKYLLYKVAPKDNEGRML